MSEEKDKIVYVLDVNLPNLPKGEQIQIAGLGTFENGKQHEIGERMAENFRSYNGRQTPVYDDETGALIGNDWQKGPTLLEASKQMYGIEVETKSSGGSSGSGGGTPSGSGSGSQTGNDKSEGGGN